MGGNRACEWANIECRYGKSIFEKPNVGMCTNCLLGKILEVKLREQKL